jgi:hypothetical protein
MSILSVRRTLVFLLLALVLTAPAASAAGLGSASPQRLAAAGEASMDVLSRFWSFLKSAWGETGCYIDPDGRCVTQPATTTQGDTGCMVDPNGRCRG